MLLRNTSQGWAVDDELRERAEHIIARWRERGFNAILCYRSGYCVPANSAVSGAPLPDGYTWYAIDSDDALEAMARSIATGDFYRP